MIRSLEKFTRNSYPGVICAALILLLTGLPGSCLPHTKPSLGLDKIAHLIMYCGFAYATLWGYRKPYQEKDRGFRIRALTITLILSVAFGALTEIMQENLIPGRVGSVFDWIADVIGSIIGIGFFYFFHRNRNKLKNEAFCK